MDGKKKLYEAVEACADNLERLNMIFPNLATDDTKESVEEWKRNKDRVVFDQTEPAKPESSVETLDIKALSLDLLGENELEDVIEILSEVHKIDLTMVEFVDAIGSELYLDALRRDARSLIANSISYSQVANLWNDLERPCMGADRWESRGVSVLVE